MNARLIRVETLVFGGGIAGLWTLARLLREGRDVLLLEKGGLGGEQTVSSQGVIHGGMKYALNGVLNDASEAIADMPRRWAESLDGKGELDLRGVRRLSDHQTLWATGGIAARAASFFASKTLSGRVRPLAREEYPEPLRDARYRGPVFELNEFVVEPASLVAALARLGQGRIFSNANGSGRFVVESGRVAAYEFQSDGILHRFEAEQFILTAGSGNQELLAQLGGPGLETPAMQRRPLHQVLVKSPNLAPFYSVAIGGSIKPPLVVTTHYGRDGVPVWYLGGDLAEKGVDFSREDQIRRARELLASLLPWMDLSGAQWRAHRIDRAEPLDPKGQRSPGAFCKRISNILVCWPSKLALAPSLADEALRLLGGPRHAAAPQPRQIGLPAPPVAEALWDRLYA